jgi:2-pyrone-4,6-dicarboxylate lactonase
MSSRRNFVKTAAACVTGLAMANRGPAMAATPSGSLPFVVPAGACDCQVHVIGHRDKYPMLPNRAYTPPEAGVRDLRAHLSSLQMSHVVLVQPSIYGTNNQYMVDALAELGKVARGVAVIDGRTTDSELIKLSAHGVRAARVNLESIGDRDPAAARRALGELASRMVPLGWHIQIYASLQVIASVADQIAKLPVPVVLDHFALAKVGEDGGQDLKTVLSLVRGGQAYAKLSAPYRISAAAPAYEEVGPLAHAFIEANPERVIWASDWPHTDRTPGVAPTEVSPFRKTDDVATLGLLAKWAPSEELRRQILVLNPARLYGL